MYSWIELHLQRETFQNYHHLSSSVYRKPNSNPEGFSLLITVWWLNSVSTQKCWYKRNVRKRPPFNQSTASWRGHLQTSLLTILQNPRLPYCTGSEFCMACIGFFFFPSSLFLRIKNFKSHHVECSFGLSNHCSCLAVPMSTMF